MGPSEERRVGKKQKLKQTTPSIATGSGNTWNKSSAEWITEKGAIGE